MKMKTNKIASKRIHVSGTGKFMRRRQNARHLKAHKSKKQLRKFMMSVPVSSAFAKTARTFLPYA